ncbi:hypothetical protein CYG48_18005 (plasmid) [Neorhizobium sp. SOG26]|uniref:LysE family translocator n=1 Tax=Neorhizobium sp. SOG26 TaxID=2060726 RepID=UPI000E584D97|nr:hypothetical protein [Neorhizobium sp. SOG26]AXV17710.1 hypothetical protein CYG48_18005 [Neorhizobium sp. SOG26]
MWLDQDLLRRHGGDAGMFPIQSVTLQLLLAYFAVLMVPGSIMITTASLAAESGVAKATPFVVGASAGAGATVVLIGAITTNAISAIPLATLQQLGSLALLMMAFVLLRAPMGQAGSKSSRVSMVALLAAGVATAISSPMTPIFALNLLTSEAASRQAPAVTGLALTITAMNLLWYSLVATALAMPRPRAFATRHLGLFRRAAAGLLCTISFSNLAQHSQHPFVQHTVVVE